MTDKLNRTASYAVSDEGSLVYLVGSSERSKWIVRLWPERQPERLSKQSAAFDTFPVDLSPDGRHLVASLDAREDIWLFDVQRGELERPISRDRFQAFIPIWSEDGLRVTWSSRPTSLRTLKPLSSRGCRAAGGSVRDGRPTEPASSSALAGASYWCRRSVLLTVFNSLSQSTFSAGSTTAAPGTWRRMEPTSLLSKGARGHGWFSSRTGSRS